MKHIYIACIVASLFGGAIAHGQTANLPPAPVPPAQAQPVPQIQQQQIQQQQRQQPQTQQPQAPLPGTGLIYAFVADGAGGERMLGENLHQVVVNTRLPVYVRSINWSRKAVVPSNYLDDRAQQRGANRMASEIMYIKQVHPGASVVVLGHSTGCRVSLMAAEKLPPATIDRMVLLYPSVSQNYDLRGASQATRGTIEVFANPENNVLETAEAELGPVDGLKGKMAGRFGFRMAAAPQARGGQVRTYRISTHHNGVLHPYFLQQYVAPLVSPR